MASEETEATDGLSYRERNVDETLEEHDSRISRLEKGALVVIGYGIAEFPDIVTTITRVLGL